MSFFVKNIDGGPVTSVHIDPPVDRMKESSDEEEYVVHVGPNIDNFLHNIFRQGMNAQRRFEKRIKKDMEKTMKKVPKASKKLRKRLPSLPRDLLAIAQRTAKRD